MTKTRLTVTFDDEMVAYARDRTGIRSLSMLCEEVLRALIDRAKADQSTVSDAVSTMADKAPRQ